MISRPSRRAWLAGVLSLVPAVRAAAILRLTTDDPDPIGRVAAIEQRLGGRLGVAMLDTGTGRSLAHRASERFAMCSTFKFLVAAAVLSRVDRRRDRLDRIIRYGPEDLLEYAPVTKQHVDEAGMSVGELVAAALQYSDNTAANLLLNALGGPAAVTAYARRLGDEVTRLDRNEPTLNAVNPGDVRDTTAPAAMLANMKTLLVETAALSAASRNQLAAWLVGNTTGAERLRAGLPAGWRVGDKTGSGSRGETNDIAIAWPPGRPPILIAAYFAGSRAPADDRNGAIADVGRIAAAEFGGRR